MHFLKTALKKHLCYHSFTVNNMMPSQKGTKSLSCFVFTVPHGRNILQPERQNLQEMAKAASLFTPWNIYQM